MMAKDPSTTRIPRLDGNSRIPPPGSFGGITSHIRPPTATAATAAAAATTNLKSSTQIFRAPSLPPNRATAMQRPISSYHPTAAPLHDLGASLKKSTSGERINNAVNSISKRTTTVFKQFFGKSKLISPSTAAVGGGASRQMSSSMPQTPVPSTRQPQQQQQQQAHLTSSTPMPLMRSETFVCDEEKQQDLEQDQGQDLEELSSNRSQLESTRLSNVGLSCTLDMSSNCGDRTRIFMPKFESDITLKDANSSMDKTRTFSPKSESEITPKDTTHIVNSFRDKTRTVIPKNESENVTKDATHIVISSRDKTRTLFPKSESETTPHDATHMVNSFRDKTRIVNPNSESETTPNDMTPIFPRDRTRFVNPTNQFQKPLNLTQTLDLTKSMDQLPLLEHMSMPSGLELELDTELNNSALDVALTALAPDKTNLKLPLNSTINTERLLDLSGVQSPARHIQLLNLTREFLEPTTPPRLYNNTVGRRSMALVCLTPQSATTTPHGARFQNTPVPVHLLSPLLKAARSDLVLPTRTPEGELDLNATLTGVQLLSRAPRTRYSFGLDLPDTTLDSSIELVDNSFSTSQQQLQQLLLKKQHSFDLDDSLGILTPDQMKEFLDSSSQHNNNNSCQLSHQLELQLLQQHQQHQQQQFQQQQQQQQRQLRLEQTPSPEELPLDPIEPQLSAVIAAPAATAPPIATAAAAATTQPSAKLSNSFITSVTSVTSLDTGYQGDGEMSRPASRGACDHSPSNGPQLGRVSRQPSFPPLPAAAQLRRPADPMTDSDFFTESDADDVLQRGDRRAQVIDGQLYGPDMLQPSASVPQLEDSCMESSGIFTDVENRCDEEMRLPELEADIDVDMDVEMDADVDVDVDVDMSPDESTQTMRKINQGQAQAKASNQPRPLSSSSAATLSLSNRTSYCSVDGGSAKSFCDEAFNGSCGSGGSGVEQQQQQRSSVQRATSPRPHASLTSLSIVENASSSSSLASPKSYTTTTTAAATVTTTATTPTTQKVATLKATKTLIARKTHAPNKWDAVMQKIASNKSIKTNYNDVKSKVSTTRNMTATTATVGNNSGSGSPTSSSSSPRISPTVRRSPSATPAAAFKRSSSVRPALSLSPSASASASTRQPQDKGSVGASAGVSVFARLAKSQSPTSPTASAATTTTTAAAKQRLQPVLIKRGRSYSKDSQKSSHSDLSSLSNGNGGGSPKLLAKTPLRAAKKRDVRNLSISPTDLGPPPKTQQTAKGQSTRNKSTTPTPTAIQKRISNNTSTSTSSTSIATISSAGNKISTKLTQQQQQQLQQQQHASQHPNKQQPNAKNVATKIKCSKPLAVSISEESLRSGVDQTELQELNELGLILSTVPIATRDSKRASLSNELACVCGADNGCNCAAEKAPKVKRCGSHNKDPNNSIEPNGCQLQPQQDANPQSSLNNTTIAIDSTNEDLNGSQSTTTMVPNRAENLVAHNLNPALKRYVDNGYLNYERLAQSLEASSQEQGEKQGQVMGLAVVVQFMSKQMDILSCQESKTKSSLEETIAMLRQQLHEKDLEWSQRQQERDHLQRVELQQAQEKVQEVQLIAKERLRELESQLHAKDEEKKQALQSYHVAVEHQLRHKQEQLNLAEQRVLKLQTSVQDHESKMQMMREKLISKENTHAMRLSSATHREEELQERVKSLTKELESLRASSEHTERDLRDRLALCQDEIEILRNAAQRRSPNNSLNADSSAELCRLTSETESLHCVLELKLSEISSLSKQNEQLQREIDEQRSLSSRITLLEAKNEMLQTELDAKSEKEKDIQQKMEEAQKAFEHESLRIQRLTCDKEQLVYHLQSRSEQLQLVQTQLHELSNCSQDNSFYNNQGQHSYSRNSSMRSTVESVCSNASETTSPPASPVIKGVIERNDSVSWVLEMDDQTPQLAASKLVRRAGSLRVNSERSSTQRRQLSLSASASSSSSNGHTNGHSNGAVGPNPLSQSMSATAVLRQGNSEVEPTTRPLCRPRSQTVCNKATSSSYDSSRPQSQSPSQSQPQRQRQRQSCELKATPASSDLPLPEWNVDQLTGSSPQPLPVEMRPRSSTVKLLACDAYPKALKKFQEIQESAGEAMVSGANSEDESCSASSEDMRSSSASSTASAAGCSLSKRQKQPSLMSIEEALLLEQVNSLNGTPMEVSWSEDAADADAVDADAADADAAEGHSFA